MLACCRAAIGFVYERFWASETEIERGERWDVVGAGAGGGVEEIVDRLVGCAYGLGDISAKSRRPDAETGAGGGAEALFGGEGLRRTTPARAARLPGSTAP